MKILILHNKYRQVGGEDHVFNAETELLKNRGHQVEILEFNNDDSVSPLQLIHNSHSVKKFRQIVTLFEPEILHVHNLFLKASPAILTEARQLKLPVVMTLHNYRLICANALLLRNGNICEKCVDQKIPISGIIHSCYRGSKLASIGMVATTNWHRLTGTWNDCVQKYIALTLFGKDKILSSSLGLKPNQIAVKPNFLEDTGMGESNRENKVLFVGRLSEEKGIHTLLEAHLSEQFELEIIGDGPLKKLVESASNSRNSLTYRGKCEQNYLLNRMKSVRAVLVPSIWYEPFGMTIIEAFACGTPVIASKIGPIPNLVTHGKNGWLFESNNTEALLEQVLKLPKGEVWDKASKTARNTYLEKYTPDINYENIMSIYKDVTEDYNE